MDETVSGPRCLLVVAVATGLLAGLASFVGPGLAGGVAAVRRGEAASFDELLVVGCAGVALLAATWLWAVACVVAVAAARGRGDADRRGVPAGLRRLVLLACGVALAGAVGVPAQASTGVGGLPLPDRATGAGVVRGATAAIRAEPARPASSPHATSVVVVHRGDTLWDLAVRHLPPGAGPAEVSACWQRIHDLNRAVIGDDPDLIQPGQRLRLPRR